MKLRLPRRRIWRVAIYLVSLGLFLLACDLLFVQYLRTIHPGFGTTRIVGPLAADGSVDYVAAIEGEAGDGVTSENNAFIPMLRAFGRGAIDSHQPADGVARRLEMEILPDKGDYYVGYSDWCKAHSLPETKEMADPGEREPFVVATPIAPQTQQWVQANQKPLDLLVEASKRPRFFVPLNCGYRVDIIASTMLPYLRLLHEAQHALLIRAMMMLDAGDVPHFQQDLLAAHRLARLLGQGPFMVDRAGATAMEISACWAGRVVATSGKLSANQARTFAADLAAVGDLPPILDPMYGGERYIELDAMQYLAKVGPLEAGRLLVAVTGPHNAVFQPAIFLFVPLAYERMMRGANHIDDGFMATAQLPTYARRIKAFELQDKTFDPGGLWNTVSGIVWGEWPVCWFIPPGMVGPTRKEFTAKMENRLTQLAFALAAYKADHGSYPETLRQLSPGYMRDIPNDLFSDQPLIYATHGDGYILYSVGPNRVDDGGTGAPARDDIVVKVP